MTEHIARSLSDVVGNTPLLALDRIAAGLPGEVVAKLDLLNPVASDKDRVVVALLDSASETGRLPPGGTVVAATSGNIAFSLAALAVPRGFGVMLVMPESIPAWRVALLRALGAEVVLTAAALGMRGATERATALALESGGYTLDQFSNPLVPQAMEGAADEIWAACEGRVAAFVAAVATGGALIGIGRRLKALSGGTVRVVAVEPAASPVVSGGVPNRHRLLGMGPPFVPEHYDASVVDEIIAVSDETAYATLLRLYRQEGVLSGPTGAAAVAAALLVAAREEMARQRVIVHIPDGMERYSEMGFWASFDTHVTILLGEIQQ